MTKLFLILIMSFFFVNGFSQIKPYKIPGDSTEYYIMDKETRDDLFIIMDENETKDSIIFSYDRSLEEAKARIAYKDSIIVLYKKKDSLRLEQIDLLEDESWIEIKGLYAVGQGMYIPSLTGSWIGTLGVGLNIEILQTFNVMPGFMSTYRQETSVDMGPFIRLELKIY